MRNPDRYQAVLGVGGLSYTTKKRGKKGFIPALLVRPDPEVCRALRNKAKRLKLIIDSDYCEVCGWKESDGAILENHHWNTRMPLFTTRCCKMCHGDFHYYFERVVYKVLVMNYLAEFVQTATDMELKKLERQLKRRYNNIPNLWWVKIRKHQSLESRKRALWQTYPMWIEYAGWLAQQENEIPQKEEFGSN